MCGNGKHLLKPGILEPNGVSALKKKLFVAPHVYQDLAAGNQTQHLKQLMFGNSKHMLKPGILERKGVSA